MRVEITRTVWFERSKISETYPVLLNYPDLEEYEDDWSWRAFITLNTMEDLCRFIKGVEHEVVVSFRFDECRIEIYDDYRE